MQQSQRYKHKIQRVKMQRSVDELVFNCSYPASEKAVLIHPVYMQCLSATLLPAGTKYQILVCLASCLCKFVNITLVLLQRATKLALQALYMLRRICLSVCPSHSGIVSKWNRVVCR